MDITLSCMIPDDFHLSQLLLRELRRSEEVMEVATQTKCTENQCQKALEKPTVLFLARWTAY